MLILSLLLAATPCTVTDGDTLRCRWSSAAKPERIRLLGIDAPELPGHCRRGRRCASGNPYASTTSLRTALSRGSLSITRVGTDRYGRTLATVRAGGTDLSCWQLARSQAIYKPQWDDGARVRRICPSSARTTSPNTRHRPPAS